MKIQTQQFRDLSEGIIQKIDSSISVPNSIYLAVNLVFDKYLGRAVVRDDTTLLGAQVQDNKSCLGIFQHITTSGISVPLATFNAADDATSVISKYTGSSWSNTKTGLTKDLKIHFATFLDTTIYMNGTDAPNTTTDGASWVSTAGNLDVGNAPTGKYVIEWKDKLYVAGVSGNLDRLYYSSVPTAGEISWTTGNGYIDIEPEEGAGAITGLAKVPGYLIIFKERSIKRWDGSSTYPESMVDIGCLSQEGIVRAGQSVFYFNQKGIYETTGGYPRKISRRIQDIIDAIPSTYYSSVSGWGDGENVYFSIGDITLDGLTLNNCVIAYRINEKTWTLFTLTTESLAWTKYVDSNGTEEIIFGDDDGNVFRFLQGDTDNSSNLNWIIQWNTREFGSRGRIKDISEAIVYGKSIRNGKLFCRINKGSDFKLVGPISKDIQKITKDLSGNYFDFRMQGSSQKGVEIIGIDFNGININLSNEQ